MFEEHPEGWRSPEDLAEGFLLAWSLELVARRQLDPRDPFGPGVTSRLPESLRNDTFGQLVRPPVWAQITSTHASIARARLTTLCIAWLLFDELNNVWHLEPGDFNQYAQALSLATGGTDRRSVFRDLSAEAAKCLLSDRIARTSSGATDLTIGETWFVTGDAKLLTDQWGHAAIPFVVGGSPISLIGENDLFRTSVWSCARVLVDMKSPDFYISKFKHRRSTIETILESGSRRFARARELPHHQALGVDIWPGWSGEIT